MTASRFLQSLPPPRRVETPAGPVMVLEHGEGPPVLALHGAMGAWDQGAILAAAALDRGHRAIAPSRPGFPGSPLAGAAAAQAQATRMIALLETLGTGPAAILAISGGGPCAVHMAALRPDLCRALVLVSTVAGPNPVDIPARFGLLRAMAGVPGLPAVLRTLTLRDIGRAAARAFPEAAMRARVLDDPETRDLYVALTESTFSAMGERIAASENDFHVTATESLPLEQVRVPTLIVHGDEDPYVDFERHARAAAARIAGAELLRLRGGGHAALFTHRGEVRSRVARFLARHDA